MLRLLLLSMDRQTTAQPPPPRPRPSPRSTAATSATALVRQRGVAWRAVCIHPSNLRVLSCPAPCFSPICTYPPAPSLPPPHPFHERSNSSKRLCGGTWLARRLTASGLACRASLVPSGAASSPACHGLSGERRSPARPPARLIGREAGAPFLFNKPGNQPGSRP